jgi:hypothetical protein
VPDDRLAAAVAELYGAAPEGFTGRRAELAAAARDAGDRAAAKAIGALRRPTRAAWVVNRLARADPSAPGKLAELAGALRAAQQAKHGPRLRELSAARGALVDALTAQALAMAGLPDPPQSLRLEVSETLTAALADPEVGAAFATGTLTRAMQWSGFGVLPAEADAGADEDSAGDNGASGAGRPSAAPADETAADAGNSAAQARERDGGPGPRPGGAGLRPVLTEVAQPRRRAGQTGAGHAAEASAARRQAAEAELLGLAEERAARRREQYEEAERAVATAASAAAEALSAEDQLEAEVRDLEQRLTQARADLAAARMRARHAEAAERRARQALDRLSLATHHRCRITHLKEHGI